MKAITFLGVRPQPANFALGNKVHEAGQCGIALARFIPGLQLRAFVTEKALAEQYPSFEHEVEDYVDDVRAVPIPDGKNEDELWRLFECVVDQIEENEDVIFDITHAFRSLPFLSFLAAAYARIVKGARIQGVYYANFEAKYGDPPRTPVIDLTEFVSLLDWMVAADLFSNSGDSSRLAGLLRMDLRDLTPQQREEKRKSALYSAVTSMQDLSKSLRLIRPNVVMEESCKLVGSLKDGAGDFVQTARPFVPLLDKVADAYRPLALAVPGEDPVAALAIERDLVKWYLDRGHLVQATAVAREWLVTWGLLQNGETNVLDTERRTQMENAITSRLPRHRKQPRETNIDITRMVRRDELVKLYDQLTNVRNDLLHVGKRLNPQELDPLEKNIRKFCARLADFPLPGGQPPAP